MECNNIISYTRVSMVMTTTIMLDQFGLIISKKRAKYAETEFVQLLKKTLAPKKLNS